MGKDLSKMPVAGGLGNDTCVIIVQNLSISLGVIACSLSPRLRASLAAILPTSKGNTLVVVVNALRLLGY